MSDHNGPQWLAVRWLPQQGGGCVQPRSAGWYVIRICRCHKNQRVTLPFVSEARAERARRAMLAASEALGT